MLISAEASAKGMEGNLNFPVLEEVQSSEPATFYQFCPFGLSLGILFFSIYNHILESIP
jgi:hypothetical protein